jgi:hypothetical protein
VVPVPVPAVPFPPVVVAFVAVVAFPVVAVVPVVRVAVPFADPFAGVDGEGEPVVAVRDASFSPVVVPSVVGVVVPSPLSLSVPTVAFAPTV